MATQIRALDIQSGVTMIELLVALVIFAILAAVGAPNLMTWIQSAQVRTASESIVNGLQLARGEAVRRNTTASFYLCSGGDSTWDVLVTSTTGKAQACNPVNSAGVTGLERVQSHSGSEGTPNAIVAVKQNGVAYNALTKPITYNGLGRLSTIQSFDIDFDVTNPKGGSCMPAGPVRCMRIVVAPGGQARMCNPAYSIANNPQGC